MRGERQRRPAFQHQDGSHALYRGDLKADRKRARAALADSSVLVSLDEDERRGPDPTDQQPQEQRREEERARQPTERPAEAAPRTDTHKLMRDDMLEGSRGGCMWGCRRGGEGRMGVRDQQQPHLIVRAARARARAQPGRGQRPARRRFPSDDTQQLDEDLTPLPVHQATSSLPAPPAGQRLLELIGLPPAERDVRCRPPPAPGELSEWRATDLATSHRRQSAPSHRGRQHLRLGVCRLVAFASVRSVGR